MTTAEKPAHQVWSLDRGGHSHRLSVWGTIRRRFEWAVDGTVVAARSSPNERVELNADGHGVVTVRFSALGSPRRATLFSEADGGVATSKIGIGGEDFVPEPGSPAARFEQRLIDHPRLYPVIEAIGSGGGILAGLAGAALVAWLASLIDWPDLPDIPWPDINVPSIPWPELPSIPWPDVTLPAWLRWLMDQLKYVIPIVVAYVLGRREVRRRHRRDHPSGDEDAA